MKIRKKQSNSSNLCDIMPDFSDKTKDGFMDSEKFADLNEHILNEKYDVNKGDSFSNVDQLDIMDISVTNFPFSSLNKIELDSFDILNEQSVELNNFEGLNDLVRNSRSEINNVCDDVKCDISNTADGLLISEDINNANSKVETLVDNDVASEVKLECDKTDNVEEPTDKKIKTDKDKGTFHNERRALKRRQKLEQSKVQCQVRTTTKHYLRMLEFFENNPGVATGQLPKMPYRKKWRELTIILNDMNMGEKTTEKWQKTWSDYKLHLKKKLAGIKRSGKALNVPNQFTDLDMRAIVIMGMCNGESDLKLIKKRFNPEPHSDSEDALVQSSVQSVNTSVSSSTGDCSSTSYVLKKPMKLIGQQSLARARKRRTMLKYQRRSLLFQKSLIQELRLMRTALKNGLSDIKAAIDNLKSFHNTSSV